MTSLRLARKSSRLGFGSRDYIPVPQGGGSPGEDGGFVAEQEYAVEKVEQAAHPANDFEGCCNIISGNKILSSLLIFVPLGIAAHHLDWAATNRFALNFMAIIPLAWLIGKATEDVAATVGETLGGLLNATFGNVVEMLLCISGIRGDEIGVVQCTLLGSILSNLLLVMGCAFFVGGLFYRQQPFLQSAASIQCSLLAMAAFSITLPTVYANILHHDEDWDNMVRASRYTSISLLLVYIAFLYFQLATHADLFQGEDGEAVEEVPDLSPAAAAILLLCTTVVTSFQTDYLIDSIQGAISQWSLSREFIGIIMLPIIGNAAEHYTAITVAYRDKIDLSLGVAVGSSCQMALLVTPFTVLAGWYFDKEMTLDFHMFQLAVLVLSVVLATTILQSGASNWFLGLILLVTYINVGLIYFLETTTDKSLGNVY
eukprot:CAMPEP_0117550492 /NCGR_PEP_ID=MMETSP0784-20121206/48709_1 /TAXON_ID=39447 /ORGANISM="" /LENGTH=427 /DNA_ID=CAMNT_0005347513 /DNA_START=28 /DNA_END=1311 /DNA_ORIENTATION=+